MSTKINQNTADVDITKKHYAVTLMVNGEQKSSSLFQNKNSARTYAFSQNMTSGFLSGIGRTVKIKLYQITPKTKNNGSIDYDFQELDY